MSKIITVEQIENKIYTIRNQKVMLDRDLLTFMSRTKGSCSGCKKKFKTIS